MDDIGTDLALDYYRQTEKRERPMNKEQKVLVQPLKKFLKKRGRNNPITEFRITGGWIDVINYNKNDRVFDIVECKIARNPVQIGKAFGQVLAYQAMIQDNGRRFFKGVLERARDWLTFEEKAKIFTEKKAKIRLYTCFAEESIKNYRRLLDIVRDKTKKQVGVVLVQKAKIKLAQEADVLVLCIQARYSKREFYQELQKDIRDQIDKIKVSRDGRYPKVARFHFVNPDIHFEVWIRRKGKDHTPIEVGLHLECSRTGRSKYIFDELLKRRKRIKNKLPNAKFEPWGRKVEWYRVYERRSYTGDINRIDEKELRFVERKLLAYIRTIKPILQEINWGRRRGTKKRN